MPYLLVETTNMRIPPPSKIYFATLLPVLALTMSSCSKKEAADNHLRYLQESDQQCVPHDAKRMEYISNLLAHEAEMKAKREKEEQQDDESQPEADE